MTKKERDKLRQTIIFSESLDEEDRFDVAGEIVIKLLDVIDSMENREQKSIKLLESFLAWAKDSSYAVEVDKFSYTHASCGYEEAQSHIKDLLEEFDECP